MFLPSDREVLLAVLCIAGAGGLGGGTLLWAGGGGLGAGIFLAVLSSTLDSEDGRSERERGDKITSYTSGSYAH